MTYRIEALCDKRWPEVWRFMHPIIEAGDTYPYATDMTIDEAHRMWLDVTDAAFVALDEQERAVGTYYLKPNQPSLGAHVANCGYMVAASARGRGVATALCAHSLAEARRRGFRAMQFNLVVSTNAASCHLWSKMGFSTVGTLPGAFRHRELGFVDAYVMYRELVTAK